MFSFVLNIMHGWGAVQDFLASKYHSYSIWVQSYEFDSHLSQLDNLDFTLSPIHIGFVLPSNQLHFTLYTRWVQIFWCKSTPTFTEGFLKPPLGLNWTDNEWPLDHGAKWTVMFIALQSSIRLKANHIKFGRNWR